jgi:spermidine synthase
MGTCYRSALTWGVPTTAVELIPDVPRAFSFYHADAPTVLNNPNGRIVIDDGRRFLERTREKYDVIVVDPPPPIEAAGCSLLFSTEFYALIKQHLKPGGIIQAWIPAGGDKTIAEGFFGSLNRSFPYVRCFPSIQHWGAHALASMTPIETLTPAQLAARMPETAKKDLLEWNLDGNATAYLGAVVQNEISLRRLLNQDPEFQITDDDPLNEYFLMRHWGLF